MQKTIFSITLQQTLYFISIFIKIIFLLFYFYFFFLSPHFSFLPRFSPTVTHMPHCLPPQSTRSTSKSIQNQPPEKSSNDHHFTKRPPLHQTANLTSKTQQQPPLYQAANSKPNIQNQPKSKSKVIQNNQITPSTQTQARFQPSTTTPPCQDRDRRKPKPVSNHQPPRHHKINREQRRAMENRGESKEREKKKKGRERKKSCKKKKP